MDTSSFFQYPGDTSAGQKQSIIFLEHASDDEWELLLNHMESCPFKAGEDLIHLGQQDNAIYIVEEGELDVLIPTTRGQLRQLTQLESGMVFGEQAFLDNQPRSATVRATTDGSVYRLSREAFSQMSQQQPALAQKVLFDLGRILSQRLREATRILGSTAG